MLNLTVFYYATPKLKGIDVYNPSRGKFGFWMMSVTMMLMTISFGIAGVVQTYVERILGMGYMTAQSYIRLWMGVTFTLGLFFFAGVIITVIDLLFMQPLKKGKS